MLAPVNAAETDSSCMLMQAYVNNNKLDIVALGDFDFPSASVKVPNWQSEITESASVSEGKVRVSATVLVDISTSIPYNTRPKVLEFIGAKIKEMNR